MKKIYTFAALALLSLQGIAQSPFLWTNTDYKGAFPVTDGATGIASNDWTAGWTEWDPFTKVYGAPTVTITSDITTNTTWTSNNVYRLVGNISVKNGATLTIEPGTVIRGGAVSDKSCLIITMGSKINAQGTAQNPIVFTSGEDPSGNGRAPGDWGGIVVLGKGITNTACGTCSTSPNQNFIEGFNPTFPEILYGGNDNNDNSGVISYVRIEFAGVALSSLANSELNSLTMGGVGRGTKLDHVQVSYGGDDGFEWFGGAVDAKYLVSYGTWDDDFDTDFGYAGRVQFGLLVRDKDQSDQSSSNGFESDNFNPGLGRLPITRAVFSNITSVGPRRDGTVALPGTDKHEHAFHIRRNTGISIYNTLVVGWEKNLLIDGATTFDNYNSTTALDSLGKVNGVVIATSTWTGTTADRFFTFNSGGANSAWYNTYAGTNAIDTTKSVSQIAWVNPFPTNFNSKPDFRLQAASIATTGAVFTHTNVTGSFEVVLTGIAVNGNDIPSLGGTSQMSAILTPSNASYQNVTWSVTNGSGSATINASGLLTGVTAGTVTVKATSVAYPAISGTKVITISDPSVGIQELDETTFSVYPNPTVNTVNVSSAYNIQSISIHSVVGQEILKVAGNKGTEMSVNVANLSNGIYLVKIVTDKGQVVKRIQVSK